MTSVPRSVSVCAVPFLVAFLPILVLVEGGYGTEDSGAEKGRAMLTPLRVSDNHRFLVTEDGRPFFWLGDTAWAVIQRYTREQTQNQPSVLKYFRSRADKKFNVIQCRLARDAETTDAYGHAAFVDKRFDQPRIVEGRDNDYWDTADWFITQARAHGFYLALLPTWFNSVPNDDPMIKDPAVAYRYGHFIGTRYRNEPHIVWVLGGDPDRRNDRDVDYPPRLVATRALAEGIADAKNGVNQFDGKADYSTTLMTYHPRGGGQSSSRLLHNEPWLDFNMIQTTSHFVFTNYRTVAADYAKRPAKPTLEGEAAYEYSVDLSHRNELDKRIQPWHVRKAAYWSVFAGGFGFTYGHRSYIGWVLAGEKLDKGADVPWFESLDSPGAFDMTHLRSLMESRPFLTCVPDQTVVADGPADPLDHVAATRSTDGSYAMLYFPTGRPVTVRMDRICGGKVRAWWFDPREGQAAEIGIFPNLGTKQFIPPSSGQDNDWVLVLDDAARDFSPPGTKGQGKESSEGVSRAAIDSPLDYFPPPDSRGGWRTLSSAEAIRRVAGMDVEKLDEAFNVAAASTKNGGLLVVRNGWLVYEKYFGRGGREATPNLGSCGKSFTSIAVGILMAEYPNLFPDGLDQRVFTPKYLPPEAFPLADPAMAEIKLGQLLAFSAGIRGNNPCYVNGKATRIDPPGPDGWPALVDEIALGKRDYFSKGQRYSAATLWCKPGGGYSYASASAQIASMVVRHVSGMELQEYLRKHLAEPLGWGRWGYGYKYAKQVTHTPGGGGIALRATDMLRFGYLLLRQGRWGRRQLVPAEYVRQCGRQSPYNPHYPYSLEFNVNTDGHYPEYPRDAFWKSGSGGHTLYIVPSLDLVVWKLAGRDSQYSQRDTGLPPAAETAKGSQSRRNWKPTISERQGQRLLLSKVIKAIVGPGSSGK
jgi:CubicO group peptidase (beta-lactamase class C family)